MQKLSYLIALVAMLALLGSGAAWWYGFRTSQLQPAAGRLEQSGRGNGAAVALLAAFGLSLVAAFSAVSAWMF